MLRVEFLIGLFLSVSILACEDQNTRSAAASAANATPSAQPNGSPSNCTERRDNFADRGLVERVCSLVNQERSAAGVQSLVLDAKLSMLAQAHAEDMVRRNYFSHNTPEGLTPFDRMRAAGIDYQTAGENIAYWYKTPEEVMQTWMSSSGHRANILKSQYGKIGIGYFQNYWVQDFTN